MASSVVFWEAIVHEVLHGAGQLSKTGGIYGYDAFLGH